jgi:hypothetical protein
VTWVSVSIDHARQCFTSHVSGPEQRAFLHVSVPTEPARHVASIFDAHAMRQALSLQSHASTQER